MNRWFLTIAAVLCIAAVPKSPWPDTPAGSVARQWVEAFPSESTMRAFLVRNVDEPDLRKRSLDERLRTYRDSKKKFSTLKFGSIVSSRPEELKVLLVSSSGEKHQFTFTVQTAAPHKLVSITRTETQQHHGFDWFHGH